MTKIFALIFILLTFAAFEFLLKPSFFSSKVTPAPETESADIYKGVSYVGVTPKDFDISILARGLVSPTRLKITPDGKYLLVSQITGELLAFKREGSEWSTKPEQLTKIETKFPGFPPDEAGLVGIVFSSEYENNGKVFLLYTFKDDPGETQNRISVTRLREDNGELTATKPQQIYQANVSGSGSHQITDGIGVKIMSRPHLLFAIGEGFKAERAQDPGMEAGKLILIQEDGSDPLGIRPFAKDPKVQALGLRNAYVLTANPFDKTINAVERKILVADTAPDHFDRLIYTQIVSSRGDALKPINFGWDGSEEKLEKPIPDPNNQAVSDMVIDRLPDTRTFVGLEFYPGRGAIPESNEKTQSILATMFGKTGSKENTPGKELWLGRLTKLSGQPKISFEPIIKRAPEADGKYGHPIGLTIDPKTGDFFFADIMEGRVYQVTIK